MNRLSTYRAATAFAALIAIFSCSDSVAGPDGLDADDLSSDPTRVLASIQVNLPADTIAVGQTIQATVTALDRRGRQLTRPVAWSTSDTSIASVSSSGVVRGKAPGKVAIIAKHKSVTGSAQLTVIDGSVSTADVASVSVSLASSTLSPGQTTQATATTKDANGNVITGRAITWASDNIAVATVSPAGVVSSVATGTANIIATSEGKSGSAPLVVQNTPPPPPPSGIADPTQLPIANRQTPPAGTYGRTLTSGQTYTDPVSGMTVLKVTDASTPIANTRAHHDYSEGGPYISQPWQGSDGNLYYTMMVAAEPNRYLVDMRYDNLTLSNWRRIDLDGDVSFAFSLDPATPRIAYGEFNSASGVVQRYNTATNQMENTGNWPWRPAAGSINWLQTQLNDKWLVAMGNNTTVVAFRPSDGVKRSYAPSGLDEPHIDREQPFAYLAVGNQNFVCNLNTGAAPFLAPGDPAWSYHPNSLENSSHNSPLRGHYTGIANSANQAYWTYNVLTNTTRSFATANQVIGFPNEWHQAGQWVFNNGNGNEAQWFAIDPSGSDWSAAAIRSGMIGLVNTDGTTQPRLLAVHNSTGGSNYQTQPHVTIAPDGKFVMWTSDSKSGRTDVYVVRVPVK